MEKFMVIDKLGMLQIETVLVETNYPIFFICKNEKEDLFLCSCCQANRFGKKWLVTKTSPDVIIKILKDEITLREAFFVFKDVQFSVCAYDDEIKIVEHDEIDWDYENSIYLPDKEEYMETEEDEFLDEISYYERKRIEAYKDIKVEKVVKHSFSEVKTSWMDETGELDTLDYNFLINGQMFEKMRIFNRLLESKIEIGLKEPKNFEFNYDDSRVEIDDIRDVISLEYKDYISAQGYMINEKSECIFITAA